MAPHGTERVGDVSNVVFSNGWILDDDDDVAEADRRVIIYYASSDTRLHVATSTVGRLLDYCINTPEDRYRTEESVRSINRLIDSNERYCK